MRVLILTVVLYSGWALTGCGGGSKSSTALPKDPVYSLRGGVTYDDGDPLAYASVALGGSPLGSITDANGRFEIENLRAGSYRLTVLYLGYRSQPVALNTAETETITRTVEMMRDQSLGKAVADSLLPVTVSFELQRSR